MIEESQYPPVTFINKSKSRIKILEVKEGGKEEMEYNEMAEYAPKIPHYQPAFKIYKVENYEFEYLGDFTLQEDFKNFGNLTVQIEEYKDKKIVMIQDIVQSQISEIKNEQLLLEMLSIFSFSIH